MGEEPANKPTQPEDESLPISASQVADSAEPAGVPVESVSPGIESSFPSIEPAAPCPETVAPAEPVALYASDSAEPAVEPAAPYAPPVSDAVFSSPVSPGPDPYVPSAPQQPPAPQQPFSLQQPFPQQQRAYYQPASSQQSGGKAIASLACGILAIVFSPLPLLGIVLGIVAIVLAAQAAKQGFAGGKTTGGKVCGIIGIVFSLVAFMLWTLLGIGVASYVADNRDIFSSNTTERIDKMLAQEEEGSATETEKEVLEAAETVLSQLENVEAITQFLGPSADQAMKEETGYSLTEMGVDPLDFANWAAGDIGYTVGGVAVDEAAGTAFVEAVVTHRDMAAASAATEAEVEAFIASGETLEDEEAAKTKVGEIIKTVMMNSREITQTPVTITVNKVGSVWMPDLEEWDATTTEIFSGTA